MLENPVYREEEDEYAGNPLIEAIPSTEEDIVILKQMQFYPRYDSEMRNMVTPARLKKLEEGLKFFQPFDIHSQIGNRLALSISSGYASRNPLAHSYWRDFYSQVENFQQVKTNPTKYLPPFGRSQSTDSASFLIYGVSGVGKTTSVNRLLTRFPQVISHTNYKGQNFYLYQITYLVLDCAASGSIRDMCLQFLAEVDSLLHTRYEHTLGRNGRATRDELVHSIARIARLHEVGLLVLDEIQFLAGIKHLNKTELLNWLTSLVNVLGIPIVFIGTPQALDVIQTDFRLARRATAAGEFFLGPMTYDENWQLFIESLWHYQYVRNRSALTQEMSKELLHLSGGITGTAIKIYKRAQQIAMFSQVETLSIQIFRYAKELLSVDEPMLYALRTNNSIVLEKYQDLRVPSNSSTTSTQHGLESVDKLRKVTRVRQETKTKDEQTTKHVELDTSPSLISTYTNAKQAGQDVYATLKAEGFIGNYKDFL